jgi:hypothetical protein
MFQHTPHPERVTESSATLGSMNQLIVEAIAILKESHGYLPEGSRFEQRYLSTLSVAFINGMREAESLSSIEQFATAFRTLWDFTQRSSPQSFVAIETSVYMDAIEGKRFLLERAKQENRLDVAFFTSEATAALPTSIREETMYSPQHLVAVARSWQKSEGSVINDFASAVRACRQEPGVRDLEMDLSLASRVSATELLELVSGTGINNIRICSAVFALMREAIDVARIASYKHALEKRLEHITHKLVESGML